MMDDWVFFALASLLVYVIGFCVGAGVVAWFLGD